MAKKISTVKSVPTLTSDSSPKSSFEAQRPGTGGTEILLTTNRHTASAQYVAAQRAETAYKAKKRSAGALKHRNEAQSHFKQSASHFKEGLKSCGKMVVAVPWMVRDWRENRQTKYEKRAVEKCVEKKKKLEEKLAKQEALHETEKEEAAATS